MDKLIFKTRNKDLLKGTLKIGGDSMDEAFKGNLENLAREVRQWAEGVLSTRWYKERLIDEFDQFFIDSVRGLEDTYTLELEKKLLKIVIIVTSTPKWKFWKGFQKVVYVKVYQKTRSYESKIRFTL